MRTVAAGPEGHRANGVDAAYDSRGGCGAEYGGHVWAPMNPDRPTGDIRGNLAFLSRRKVLFW